MKASHVPPRMLALCWLAAAVSLAANDKPAPAGEAELRAAITKSLGYLARGGDEWMAEKNCNSCHHMPQLLWNHREAKRRGFSVDDRKFEEWLKWSDGNAKNIGAGREMTAFMKLAMPDRPAPELTRILSQGQQADGSWKPSGQFTAQKRDMPEVTANSTRIFLLALAANASDKQASDEAGGKAAALVAKVQPAKSVETLAYRALYARRFGNHDELASIQHEIAAAQHEDGGWSWLIGESKGDSIATGLALFALQPFVDPDATAAVARGQRWLLAGQKEDGGWPVDLARISKNPRNTPDKTKSLKDATMIYSYWGTAWSTLGLLQGLPLQETAAAR